MNTVASLRALAERAVPFLRDEGAKYDDDGSNEPLELAREIEAALATPEQPGSAVQGEADGRFVLWFFRDILDEHRLALFSLFGLPVDELRTHDAQRRALAHVLTTPPPAPSAEQGEAVELTKCCGREECGGECGNEWRGMEWVRKAQPEARGVEGMDSKEKGRLIRKINYTLWMQGNGDGCEPTPDWQEGYNVGLSTPNPVVACANAPVRAEQPEGKWKLVPVEPTHAMELALSNALASGDYSIGKCLEIALAAAPAAPGAAVEVDAKNAARYRFLRQPGNAIVYTMHPEAWGMCSPPRSGHVRYETPEQLDAAIDEAMFAALAGKAQEESNG